MLWLTIDRHSNVPLSKQVVQSIRSPILDGKLPAGERLPSTRELARQLGVSRNVTVEAYEMLLCEGFIEGKSGSGTYVAEGAALAGYMEAPEQPEAPGGLMAVSDPDWIEFRTGLPALDEFPRDKWGAALRDVYRQASPGMLAYGDPAGSAELRTSLSRYLDRMRGVQSRPEHIVITSGAVQALQLAVRLLLSSGDSIVIEDPSNADLQSIMSSSGASLLPVPVDEAGICTALLPGTKRPACIYVTPSHQFPYGGYLPIQRRVELITYARMNGSLILEDDYDSEFRYEGASIHSLHSLEPERVIYIGTFSKVLCPSLRLGYMVLPPALVEPICRLKRLEDYQSPVAEQLALHRFIANGWLDAHIFRMKKVYRKRQKALLDSLEACFPGRHKVYGAATGLHVAVAFDFPVAEDMLRRLDCLKVRITPIQSHALLPLTASGHFLLGYGHLTEERIREGIRRVWQAFDGGEVSNEPVRTQQKLNQ